MDAEFDRYAELYEEQHRANVAITGEGPDYFARYKIEALTALVDPAAVRRILDFGSGIGNSIPHFRALFPKAELTCADVSERSLDQAARRHPGPERRLLVRGDRIPAEDGSFDLVFSACVFHHIPHDQHVGWLAELHRVTAPGGLAAVFEHNPWNPLTLRAVNTCPFDENAVLLSAVQLKRRFRQAGWTAPASRFHLFFPRMLAGLRPMEPWLAAVPLGGQYAVHACRAGG